MVVAAVYRDRRFSPNSVEADRAILDETARRLCHLLKCQRLDIEETDLVTHGAMAGIGSSTDETVWLSMGRLPATLEWLKEREAAGQLVVNSPRGVAACTRSRLHRLMLDEGLPVAPAEGVQGYWLKRGDQAAQSPQDVVYAADEREKSMCLDAFRQRGVDDVVVTAHVPGDLVKFYGVAGTGFFRYFYPTADGKGKFDDEQRNGSPHYHPFDEKQLVEVAERVAGLTGVDVYGGDCIVKADGTFCLIDFNDWPSFSRCREEAAVAIARHVAHRTTLMK